jgi:aspartate/glutamate racemase
VAKHLTQLLYVVHCGVPLVEAVLRTLSMADADRSRTTKVRTATEARCDCEEWRGTIILGCTEIGLLIKPGHSALPLLDTTELHAQAAVAFALGD